MPYTPGLTDIKELLGFLTDPANKKIADKEERKAFEGAVKNELPKDVKKAVTKAESVAELTGKTLSGKGSAAKNPRQMDFSNVLLA